MYSSTNDISLIDLVRQGHINKKLAQFLSSAGLDSLSKIMHFFLQHKCFYRIQPYISNANEKLVAFCLKFESEFEYFKGISSQDNINYYQANLISIISQFSELKSIIFYYQFAYFISKLNPRLTKIFEQLFKEHSMQRIIELIFVENLNLISFRFIGVTSLNEWETVKNEIEDFVFHLDTITNNEAFKIYLHTFIINNFKQRDIIENANFESIFDQNNKVKLFALIKLLVEQDLLFKKVEKLYFYFLFNYNVERIITYESIGNVFGLTRERIRQIKIAMIENLSKDFNFIIELNSNKFINNYLDVSKNIIVLDDEIVQQFNEQEGVSYNLKLYGFILGILYQETHVMLSELYLDNKKIKPQQVLLIKSSMMKSFDFVEFLKDLEIMVSHTSKKNLSLPFYKYIAKFIKHADEVDLKEIRAVCRVIVLKLYNITISNKGIIVFKSSVRKLLFDYIYEVFEDTGHTMSLQEIGDALKSKYPKIKFVNTSIRTIITTNKDVFICISKTSTYGLKKWEKHKKNIKGGTIKSIAVEFLKKHNTPMFFEDIFQYVSRYRKTTRANIMSSFRSDPKNTYSFFNANHIGLTSKVYKKKFDNFNELSLTKLDKTELRPLIGQSMEDIISHFVSKIGYSEMQVKNILKLRIHSNIITFSENNILMSVAEPRPHKPYKPRQKKSN